MNHFTMGQTLGTFHGPQISPPPITWGLSQQSTSSTFIEASTFYIIRGRWLCVYECSQHPGCYKVIQLTLGSDFQESHAVPSASVICCLLLCSDAWAGSLKEYQRCQQVPKCRGGCQEHPWKASSWPCTRPDKLLKLLWVSAPAWPTVRLSSSVRLSLAQPCPPCWVWKPGSGLLIQIKAVSWAVWAAVTEYHPWVPFKQQFLLVDKAGSSRSGRCHGWWELCSHCVPKDWKAPDNWKKFPFHVCVWAQIWPYES